MYSTTTIPLRLASLVLISLALISSDRTLGAFSKSPANSAEINGKHATRMSIARERMNNQVPAPFYDVLRKALAKRKTSIENICPRSDSVARRVLEDYGAMFVASKE